MTGLMSQMTGVTGALCTLIACASAVTAAVYTDPAGDIATGNANLDITQVEITDNGADVFLTLTVDDLDGDWGKYMIFFDFNGPDAGSPDNDNPWGRDVSGLAGIDTFVGTWLDGGGGSSMSDYVDGGWIPSSGDVTASLSIDWDNDTIKWTFVNAVTASVADGYSGFDFELGTTGGGWGDPAIDLIGAEGTQPGWGNGSHSVDRLRYDFTVVPAPSAIALLGLAGLASRRRRR